MLLNSDIFLATVQSYRLCWISGRFGGGKTSLAYRVAREFLERGYRLITNNESIWGDTFDEVQLLESNHLKAVILLDEGGLWFKSSKQIEMIASYAAKMDCIYLIPSFWPPTRAAQVLITQPIFNLKAAGLPIIVYKWRVKIGSFDDKGFFLWVNPSEIYGIYSRQDPGDTGSEVISFLLERTEQFRRKYGRADSVSALETIGEVTEEEVFQDAVNTLASSIDEFASVSRGKNSRRRI